MLAQNIVYAAYHKPMTVHEIAEELGVPPAYLEDEVIQLAEYSFLSETSPGKYQSNTIIWEPSKEQVEARHGMYAACAAQIADASFDALMAVRAQIDETGIYYPDRDYNFLLWTLLPKYIEEQAWRSVPAKASFEAVAPLRKDGGQYIAYARLEGRGFQNLSFDPHHYDYNGTMNRYKKGSPLFLWQFNTYWSDRKGWKDLNFRDVEMCSAFWTGELKDEEANRERLAFLLEKAYIRKEADGYVFNTVRIDSPEILRAVNAAMPDLSGVYTPAITKLYEQMLQLVLRDHPKHLEPQLTHMVRGNTCGGGLIPYVLKHLVDNGKLKEPLPHQRKTITTWMGPVKEWG